MWIVYAAGSAFFAGLTSILTKLGIKKTDSTLATAVRTIVVLLFSWLMVFVTGAQKDFGELDASVMVNLIVSGLATGASWLCYFRALQKGPASQVAAVDKFSTVITILLSFLLLAETVRFFSVIGTAAIAAGTFLMLDPNPFLEKRAQRKEKSGRWFCLAFLSALFAALSSIFGKIGIVHVDSNLGTAIRTAVVLVLSWALVFARGKQRQISSVSKKEWILILASGVSTGASWLCFYRALQSGPASAVVPIDKLSILITVLFSVLVLHEKLKPKAWIGLAVLCFGTVLMVL